MGWWRSDGEHLITIAVGVGRRSSAIVDLSLDPPVRIMGVTHSAAVGIIDAGQTPMGEGLGRDHAGWIGGGDGPIAAAGQAALDVGRLAETGLPLLQPIDAALVDCDTLWGAAAGGGIERGGGPLHGGAVGRGDFVFGLGNPVDDQIDRVVGVQVDGLDRLAAAIVIGHEGRDTVGIGLADALAFVVVFHRCECAVGVFHTDGAPGDVGEGLYPLGFGGGRADANFLGPFPAGPDTAALRQTCRSTVTLVACQDSSTHCPNDLIAPSRSAFRRWGASEDALSRKAMPADSAAGTPDDTRLSWLQQLKECLKDHL